ncbi:MAG: hypothetical protein PVF27_03425 [Gemmatimonadales bacterium]
MSTTRRILLAIGAPTVVLVGLLGMWGYRNAAQLKAQIDTWGDSLEHSPNPVTMDLPIMPMWVGGNYVGNLRTVVVQRDAPATVDSLMLRIALSDDERAEQWAGCAFHFDPDAFEREGPLGFLQALQCLDAPGDLVRFGTVRFAGSDLSAGLYLAPGDLPCEHMDADVEACSKLNLEIRQAVQDLKSEVRVHIRDLEIR